MEIVKHQTDQQLGLSLQQPKKFYAELQIKTLSDIATSQTPALAAIAKHHGSVVAKSLLIIALDDLINFFNVTNNFTDGQINQTADLILENFYWLKPEDFKLCFNQAKIGKYGVTYNRLDGSVIFEWLNLYQEERAQHFATIRPKENYAPAIRTNDTKEIHALYDQVVEEEIARKQKNARIEELKTEAVHQWHSDYNDHFEGVEITQELHDAYIAKYPLTESYIRFYIKKHMADQ